ncbi:MAG TPA: AAA family ATPase [Burkholderiales bacterium]|nr:AAA family ATPase [Burkholderiales bacterium]
MKVAILSLKAETLKELKGFLATDDGSLEVALFNGGPQQVGPVVEQEHPDLLIMDGLCSNHAELAVLEKVASLYPAMAIMVTCQQQSQDFLLRAMRIGVREVLPSPVTKEAVQQAVGRIKQRVSWSRAPRNKGKVLAFLPCKGGSGATFLATNLAYTLAAEEDKRVALFDFNLHFGDALLFVSDAAASSTVADVTRQIQRLDASFLDSSMVKVLPSFGVLASPESPEKVADVKAENVERLLNVAVNHYDFVILDIARTLDAVSIKALDYADMVFPVLQVTLPFIRDAKRLINVFHSLGYSNNKINLIVNRFEKGGEISLEDLERTLGLKVHKTIPNSFNTVAASINQGMPILKLASRDPVSRALQEMSGGLANGAKQSASWLKKILKTS